jgi:hypothetical protein
MSFIQPIGLLFGLLAVPILLLYMLKIRRPEIRVPSTLLWAKAMRDRQANTPWQKLRRNLLLLLQLLILASLVLAIARPVVPVPGLAADTIYILLDASASMNATDVSPTRFEAAQQAVKDLIAAMAPGTRMTLILVGEQPEVLASGASDKAEVRAALDRARPGNGGGGWSSALALAAAAVAREPGEVVTVIVSDGGLADQAFSSFPSDIRYLPIGQGDDNLAISAMASRATDTAAELFLQLDNYGSARREMVLSLYIDSRLARSDRIELAGGESRGVVWDDLPSDSRVFEARLEGTGDAPLDDLALDDSAYAVHRPARQRRALLFPYSTEPLRYNLFVEKALLAMEDLAPFRAVPAEDGELRIPVDPFDLYVIDGLWPEATPAGNLLLINPPENPLFEVHEQAAVSELVRVQPHPLTRFVEWQGVHVSTARRIEPPSGSQLLVETDQVPLVVTAEDVNRRLAILAFDLHDSDLPLQIAFPILFANLVNFLAPPLAFEDANLRPGEPLVMRPSSEVTQVSVTSPTGRVIPIAPSQSGFVFSETSELGLYQALFSSPTAQTSEPFAVNLFQPGESAIRPAESLNIGSGRVLAAAAPESGEWELWPWLAGFALLILIVEWWADHRGQLIPNVRSLLKVWRRSAGPRPAREG